MVRSLLQGEAADCSKGGQTLDFMHVEDAAAALVALLGSEAQGPVNIGSGRPVALREVLEEIGRQLDRTELIRFGALQSSSSDSRLWANIEKLKDAVGFTAQYELWQGIEQTIAWWKSAMNMPAASRAKSLIPVTT